MLTTYPQAAIDKMLAAIQFDAQGLVPAIAQQRGSGEVLMMAWMDRAAVVFTRDNRHAQDFTADRARLLAAVDSYSVGFTGSTRRIFAGTPFTK